VIVIETLDKVQKSKMCHIFGPACIAYTFLHLSRTWIRDQLR